MRARRFQTYRSFQENRPVFVVLAGLLVLYIIWTTLVSRYLFSSSPEPSKFVPESALPTRAAAPPRRLTSADIDAVIQGEADSKLAAQATAARQALAKREAQHRADIAALEALPPLYDADGRIPALKGGLFDTVAAPTGDIWNPNQLLTINAYWRRILQAYPLHVRQLVLSMPADDFVHISAGRVHYDGGRGIPDIMPSYERSAAAMSVRNGVSIISAASVCYDTTADQLLFYQGSDDKPVISDSDLRLLTGKLGGFGVHYSIVNQAGWPPSMSEAIMWHDGMTVLLHPGHAATPVSTLLAAAPLFHIALHPRVYASMNNVKRIFLPTVQSAGGWTSQFIKVAMSPLNNVAAISVVTFDSMREVRMHCFRQVIAVGSTHPALGVHADPWEAHLVRQSAYLLFSVAKPARVVPYARSFVVVLGGTAAPHLVNTAEVLETVTRTGIGRVFVPDFPLDQPVDLAALPFAQQLAIMRRADILIGAVSPAMAAASFMSPGSVVIGITASPYVPVRMSQIISASGSVFLHQPSPRPDADQCPDPVPFECLALPPFAASRTACAALHACNVIADTGVTEGLLRLADFHVRNQKRGLARSAHADPYGVGVDEDGEELPIVDPIFS